MPELGIDVEMLETEGVSKLFGATLDGVSLERTEICDRGVEIDDSGFWLLGVKDDKNGRGVKTGGGGTADRRDFDSRVWGTLGCGTGMVEGGDWFDVVLVGLNC
jgi:hypothetical protein